MDIESAIAELRDRNEPVPIPGRLPTEYEVAAAESAAGVWFPEDYRYFLLHGSDVTYGSLEPALVTLDAGYRSLITIIKEARELGVPAELLPFCEDNGDYYCIATSGEVVYWDHNGTSDESWRSLADWIDEVWIGESEDEDDDE